MTTRYAVYLAPGPETALWRFGSAVLGYDAETGEAPDQLVPPGIEAGAFHALTADPRSYGFHATIRAPFRLAEGRTEDALVQALLDFGRTLAPFVLPTLQVEAIRRRPGADGFAALVEPRPTPALLDLERRTLEAFQGFRAPLNEAERLRRKPETLGPREREYLDRYGYPHVLEAFRFHLSLTGRVPGAILDDLVTGLATLHAGHVGPGPVPVEELALFRQDGPAAFRVLARAPFGGPA